MHVHWYSCDAYCNIICKLDTKIGSKPNWLSQLVRTTKFWSFLSYTSPNSPRLLLNSKNSIIKTPNVPLIPEMTTLLKAYLRWKINHMLVSNISLNNDFGSGFKIQECPGLNIALPGVWEFTLWSESKVIKKWIGASLAPLSCQISVVSTQENIAPSLRNKCLSFGCNAEFDRN